MLTVLMNFYSLKRNFSISILADVYKLCISFPDILNGNKADLVFQLM